MYRYITTYIITIAAGLIFSFPVLAQSNQIISEPVLDSTSKTIEQKSATYGTLEADVDELDVRNMDIKDVLEIISLKTGVKINYDEEIIGQVTVLLKETNILEALRIIVDMHDLAFIQLKSNGEDKKAIHVMSGQRYESLYGYSFRQKKTREEVVVSYTEPDLLLPQLRQMKSATGDVVFEKQRNAFVLYDIPSKIKMMKDFIKREDIPSSNNILSVVDTDLPIEKIEEPEIEEVEEKIEIEEEVAKEDEDSLFSIFRVGSRQQKYQVKMNILEITLNDEHQEGVDWEAIVANYQDLPFLGFRSTAKYDPDGELRVGTISDEDYIVLLDALDTVGVMETLKDDKFRARLEKEYEIDIKPSDKILVTDIREYKEMFKRDEYIRLTFSTTTDPEGLFEVNIAPEIRPNYYARNVGDLLVKLEEKHVIVIGGIFKDIQIKGTRKIPILGNLPFLGFAFRDNEERIRKVEYVVFLTLENLD